jgi:hypothetical protein
MSNSLFLSHLPLHAESRASARRIHFSAAKRGVLSLLFLVSFAVNAALGADPQGGDRSRAHARAGEFGLARAAAKQVADGAQRDRLLGEVAVAQARNGALGGAAGSLRDVRSDYERTQAIDTISRSPMGGAAGGAAMADFDTLIDLIVATVAPDSWLEEGGAGTIESFPTGVYVDAEGILRKTTLETRSLDLIRREATRRTGTQDVTRTSELRKVSLPRLEKAIQLAWMEGRSPDETMRNMAGIHRIEYVLVYPETGDVVVAGPAGDWMRSEEGWNLNKDSRTPVVQLDDLVVLMRQMKGNAVPFGCAITPRQENLERTLRFLEKSAAQPLRVSQRAEWLEEIRSTVGRQDIEVFGIDPQSRAARILVEADYHMKLIGIGLEEGTLGVPSYLDLLAERGGAQGELDVLRWWFAMHYDAVRANASGDAYQFVGQAVKLMSENELLTARGERVHTGESDDLNRAFAAGFTKQFGVLAQKYPIYGELRNVFDLALVAHLVERQGLAELAGWNALHWSDPQRFQVSRERVPREVESVANVQKMGRNVLTAVVSGGVHANPSSWLTSTKLAEEERGELTYLHGDSAAKSNLPADAWWWD